MWLFSVLCAARQGRYHQAPYRSTPGISTNDPVADGGERIDAMEKCIEPGHAPGSSCWQPSALGEVIEGIAYLAAIGQAPVVLPVLNPPDRDIEDGRKLSGREAVRFAHGAHPIVAGRGRARWRTRDWRRGKLTHGSHLLNERPGTAFGIGA